MPARGRLIALEGIDGCGKSTQAASLAEALGARLTFEPGATPVGAALRELLLAPDAPPPSPRAEALLMAADRAEHVARVLAPALAAGEWVVTDRYAGSTIAYQGYGQGLDAGRAGGADPLGHRRPGRRPVDPRRRQRRRGGGPSRRRRAGARLIGWSASGADFARAGARRFRGPGGGRPRALDRRRRDAGGRRARRRIFWPSVRERLGDAPAGRR